MRWRGAVWKIPAARADFSPISMKRRRGCFPEDWLMRRLDVAWLLVWAALSSAWCVSAAPELSAVFDEPNNLRWGVTSWRTGSNYSFMRAGTMPLPVDVQYLPIHWWERSRGQ